MLKEENKTMLDRSKMVLSPKNDYVFKRIFGHKGNEDITKGLLSAIMKKEIKNIDLDKNKILEKDLITDKFGILDIRATIDNEEDVDIEMQVVDHGNIEERIVFYSAKRLAEGIVSGEDYKNLKKVVVILITDYEIKKLSKIKKMLSKWQIREETYQNEVLTEKLEFYILELPKYAKYKGVNEKLNNWVRFIESPGEIDMSEIKDENIKKAKEELDTMNMDEYEKDMAFRREIFLHDQATMKARAYEKGEKSGMEKGEKIGEYNSKIEIAKNMLKKSMDIDTIIEITGLTEDEIKKIKIEN